MNHHLWTRWLEATLADLRLGDDERQDFQKKLQHSPVSDEDRAFIRNQSFKLAHQHIEKGAGAGPILRWLERVIKVIDGTRAEHVTELASSWFSPGNDCFNGIIEQLKTARKTIDICVFTIADDNLTKHIVAAHQRGVSVRVITDWQKSFDKGSDVNYLARKGIGVKVDNTDYHMHHKFAIFDGMRMINGSFNWTRSASVYNQEDITLTDDLRFIAAFKQQFDRLWQMFPAIPKSNKKDKTMTKLDSEPTGQPVPPHRGTMDELQAEPEKYTPHAVPIPSAKKAESPESAVATPPITRLPTDNLDPKVAQLASGFDPFDTVATITFGKDALEKITDFSDQILDQIRIRDSGEAGEVLQQMVLSMNRSEFDQLGEQSVLSRLPLIGELFDSFKKFSTSFDSVKEQLDKLAERLEGQEAKLGHDIGQLDQLYAHNLELLRGLEDYIDAGKFKLTELNTVVLPALLKQSEQSNDALDAQKYRDATQAVARLEKRIHNLELTRMAAIQTAPQIRLSQEGNKMLMEDIQDIVHNTFPLWKRQFLIAISNYEKEKALKVTRAVKDYTNQQYQKNAEKLKALEEQIAENYQRGILDVETLQAVNQLTIDTLNNTLSRVKEGRAQRDQAQKVIEKAEQELKDALQQSLEH